MLQALAPTVTRFDRTQVVLEILSRDGALAVRGALGFAAGAEVQATILQRLPAEEGGGYLVAFQGRSLGLPLRGDYAPGQVVRLAFAASAEVSLAATSANPVSLGADALLISAILSRSADLPAGAPLQLQAAGDVPQATPPDADSLKQALAESGVFYESHVAEWAQGERTIEALRREPQGRVESPADSLSPGTGTGAESATSGIPEQLVPVVKEQLQAIDARQIGWRGEIWPQQTIELTIAEEDAGTPEEQAPAAWTTTMKLDLPRLGGIQAVLQMQGDSLRIGMRASENATHSLKDRGGELAASLAALGLKLVSMRVDEHGAPAV
jgi:hypothetical protein